jgi:two-component system nitrogen regulation sensor histidine kinase NtrY
MDAPATPRRFRRRLLALMLTLGLSPLLAWGVASHLLTTQVLALRPARFDRLLAQIDERLGRTPSDEVLRQELVATRLNLAQAELARRSLARLMPRLLLVMLAITALVLALAAALVGRQLARPQELLAMGMARYARGDLAHRIPDLGGSSVDEMQFLVRQFNRMGDELAAQRARLEVSEALAAWQGVARSLAHELKNPLTAMRMAVGRLTRLAAAPHAQGAAERHDESVVLIDRQIEALLRLAQSFAAFAKLPAPELRPIELAPVVTDVCSLYRHTSPVAIEDVVAPGIVVQADAELLGRALGNLVKNAVEASQAQGEPVRVAVSVDGRRLSIEVIDGGRGVGTLIEGTALARSLGTTKAEGSGLGLPIAHKIIHEHGGALRLEPRPEGGTRAVVELPLERGA